MYEKTLREMGISPLEMEDDNLETSQESEGSDYTGTGTEGSMESNEFTEGSSEYSQSEGQEPC